MGNNPLERWEVAAPTVVPFGRPSEKVLSVAKRNWRAHTGVSVGGS